MAGITERWDLRYDLFGGLEVLKVCGQIQKLSTDSQVIIIRELDKNSSYWKDPYL